MYYEEKIINGIIWFRTSPDTEFRTRFNSLYQEEK
jgi:hypothetical protein